MTVTAAASTTRWELYRVLAEPVRLRLLALAGEEELAIGELACAARAERERDEDEEGVRSQAVGHQCRCAKYPSRPVLFECKTQTRGHSRKVSSGLNAERRT